MLGTNSELVPPLAALLDLLKAGLVQGKAYPTCVHKRMRAYTPLFLWSEVPLGIVSASVRAHGIIPLLDLILYQML